MFTIKSLSSDIRKMGIVAGDTVIIHASMKSIGPVKGGPQAVIRAFQQAVTRKGSIIMPAFSYCFEKVYEQAAPFDPKKSPSQVGLLSETFRRMKGVVRSLHPTHSVAAWGKSAPELVEGHEKIPGLSAGSPFHRAAKRGAKLCLIGCGFTSLSLLHIAEDLAKLPFLPIFNWWHAGWKPSALVKSGRGVDKIMYENIPGCSRNFGVAEDLARQRRLIREGRLGNAKVLLADASSVLNLITTRLGRQKDFLLCPAGTCRACDERRVVFEQTTPAEKYIGGFMIETVNRAGIRLAGSAGEDKAAEIIADRMKEIGLSNVGIMGFPILVWRPGFAGLSVNIGSEWKNIPAAPVSHGPAAPPAGIEGRTMVLENAKDISKVLKSGADIAVLWGNFGASALEFQKMMSSPVKAFIFVDSRFEHGDLVSVGVPAQWIRFFKRPMISISFADAVRIFGRGPVHCRLKVTGDNVPGFSSIVTGEIRGAGSGVILVGGHHDSTFNSPAPDDNLTGVAIALAVAKRLQNERGLRHAIRFCSFGTEEILSEGARWYAFESGLARDVRFVVNNDAIGARAGITNVYITGAPALSDWVSRRIAKTSLQIQAAKEINPFSDHFPFNAIGIPSLWFYRKTTASGRHYHHTVRDTLAEISFKGIADLARFEADLIISMARSDKFPFPIDIPPEMKALIKVKRRDWLGK
jgi:aminoglycoside 3-N-acetyltransferase